MFRPAVSLAIAAMMLAPAGARQDDEKGFEKVFDGESFKGLKFHAKGDPTGIWRIEGGVLQCTGEIEGYCYTEKKYKDLTLRFDWRFPRPADLKDDSKFEGSAGYFLWVGEHKIWPYSLECQGMNKQAGYIYVIDPKGREKNKFAYDDKARARAVKAVGEWNTYEIVARKGSVVVSINGVKVTTVSSHEFSEAGHVAFASKGSEIHWRNIRIKPE